MRNIKILFGLIALAALTACSGLPSIPFLNKVPTNTPGSIGTAQPAALIAATANTQTCGDTVPRVICPTCAPSQTQIPSATLTFTPEFSPTPSQTPTFTQTATNTLIPTKTLTPSRTPTSTFTLTPTKTPTFTRTPSLTPDTRPYTLQANTPAYLQNFAHPESGCNWMGAAGQVFNKSGGVVLSLVVVVDGTLNGRAVEALGMTGLAPAYGPGGFEIPLGNQALASSGTLFIQLFDISGNEISPRVPFNTFADCSKGLVLINFTLK